MYVKVDEEGTAVEYTVQQLIRDKKFTSFPKDISHELLAKHYMYPCVEQPKPEYNPFLQKITYEIVKVGDEWQKQWVLTDRDVESVVRSYQEQVALHRWRKETGGINWIDAAGNTWFIATDLDSQGRLNSVVTAVQQGLRTENGVWKCGKVVGADNIETYYRTTTNDEVIELGELVHSHVQKCFTAEANMMTKVMAGDYTSSFEQEFLAL